MATVQILDKLSLQIQSNPEIITQLPWDDIRLCIQAEFQERENLYSPSQYQTLMLELKQTFLELQQAQMDFDYRKIISILSNFSFALKVMPSTDFALQHYQRINYLEACLNHYQKDTTIVIGDSHVNFFSGNELLSFVPIGNDINTCPQMTNHAITTLHLGPCLAYHCNTPNTTYCFKEKVDHLIQNFIKPNAKLIVCLGEIDIRVHVFPQSQKQNRPYTEIVDDIIKEYIQFLCKLKNSGLQISCWGPIASQKDSCPLDPAFPRNGSEQERNKATEYFNQQLSEKCNENGIRFFSIFPQMITKNYETLEDCLSADRCHLGQAAMPLAQPFLHI